MIDKSFKLYKRTIPLFLIPALFLSVFPGKISVILVLCYLPLLVGYYKRFKSYKNNTLAYKSLLLFFLIYNYILFIRGIFNIADFYDFKQLFAMDVFYFVFFPLIPLFVNLQSFNIFIKQYLKYIVPVAAFIFIMVRVVIGLNADANIDVPHMLSGFLFLLFLFPYISNRTRIIFVIIITLSLLSDISVRSNLLNTAAAFSILLISLLISNMRLLRLFAKGVYIITLSLVILFTYLGIKGNFNIFAIGDMISLNYSVGNDNTMKGNRDVLVDSRTMIYEDVWNGLSENNSFVFGLGGVGKVTSYLEKSTVGEHREGRTWQESGMLNYLQWGGFVGAILYALLFVLSSYFAIWKSRNKYMLCLGIFIIYKLVFSFMEDPQSCSISYFLLMVFITLGFNKAFVYMTDVEFKKYINGFVK